MGYCNQCIIVVGSYYWVRQDKVVYESSMNVTQLIALLYTVSCCTE